jgi:hypothetical protein
VETDSADQSQLREVAQRRGNSNKRQLRREATNRYKQEEVPRRRGCSNKE